MRFLEKRKSNVDKEVEVAVIKMSKEEVKTLYDIVLEAEKKTPKAFDTQPFRQRLVQMRKALFETLDEMDWHPSNHNHFKFKGQKVDE